MYRKPYGSSQFRKYENAKQPQINKYTEPQQQCQPWTSRLTVKDLETRVNEELSALEQRVSQIEDLLMSSSLHDNEDLGLSDQEDSLDSGTDDEPMNSKPSTLPPQRPFLRQASSTPSQVSQPVPITTKESEERS